jgi:hypothetical protein
MDMANIQFAQIHGLSLDDEGYNRQNNTSPPHSPGRNLSSKNRSRLNRPLQVIVPSPSLKPSGSSTAS